MPQSSHSQSSLRKQVEALLHDKLAHGKNEFDIASSTPSASSTISSHLDHWYAMGDEELTKLFCDLDQALLRIASEEMTSLAPLSILYMRLLRYNITGTNSVNVSDVHDDSLRMDNVNGSGDGEDEDLEMEGFLRDKAPVPPELAKLKLLSHFLKSKAAHVVLAMCAIEPANKENSIAPVWMLRPLIDTFERLMQQLKEQQWVQNSAILTLIQEIHKNVFLIALQLVDVIARVVQSNADLNRFVSLRAVNTILLEMIVAMLQMYTQFVEAGEKDPHPDYIATCWSACIKDVRQCNMHWLEILTKANVGNADSKIDVDPDMENMILICNVVLEHCSKAELWQTDFCHWCFSTVTSILCQNVDPITRYIRNQELAAPNSSIIPRASSVLHAAISSMAKLMHMQSQGLQFSMILTHHTHSSQHVANQLANFITTMRGGIITLLPTYAHILAENRIRLLNTLSFVTGCIARVMIAVGESRIPDPQRNKYQETLDNLITVPIRGVFTKIMSQSTGAFVAVLRDMDFNNKITEDSVLATEPKMSDDPIDSITQEDATFGGILVIMTVLSILSRDDIVAALYRVPAFERFIFTDFVKITFQYIERCNPLLLTAATNAYPTTGNQAKLKGNVFMRLWRAFCFPITSQLFIERQPGDTLFVSNQWNEIEVLLWRTAVLSPSTLARRLASDMLGLVFLHFCNLSSREPAAVTSTPHPFALRMTMLFADMAAIVADNLFGISPEEPSDTYKQQQNQCFNNVCDLVNLMVSLMPRPLLVKFIQHLSIDSLMIGESGTLSISKLTSVQIFRLALLSPTNIKVIATSLDKLGNVFVASIDASIAIGTASVDQNCNDDDNKEDGFNSRSELSLLCALLKSIHTLIQYADDTANVARLIGRIDHSIMLSFVGMLLMMLGQYKDDIQQQAEYRGSLANKPMTVDRNRWWRESCLRHSLAILASLIRLQQQCATVPSASIIQILQCCKVLFTHCFWARPMITQVAAALGDFNILSVTNHSQQQQLIHELVELFVLILSSSISVVNFTGLDAQGATIPSVSLNTTGASEMRDDGIKWIMVLIAVDSFVQFQRATQRKDLAAKIMSSLGETIRKSLQILMMMIDSEATTSDTSTLSKIASQLVFAPDATRQQMQQQLSDLETEVKKLVALESRISSTSPALPSQDLQRANCLQRAQRAMSLAVEQLCMAGQFSHSSSAAVIHEMNKAKETFQNLESIARDVL